MKTHTQPASISLRLLALTSLLPLIPATLGAAGTEQLSFTAAHDTFIQRGTTANNGSGTTFMVKREGATISGGTDRIGYLRFDVPGAFSAVDSASLILTFLQYPGDGTTPFTFRVYGLPDGHANENFDESTLNFSNATNASTTLAGSLNPAGLSDLGTFTPAVASGGPKITFSSAALNAFLAANANTRVSFIIFRSTANGAATYIHSRQASTTSQRPTLLVRIPSDALTVAATTASSTLAGSSPDYATDSDYDTRWSAIADTSTTKSSLTHDLGFTQPVNRFSFIAYQHGRYYKLESSPDNSTWSTIIESYPSGTGASVNSLLETTTRYFPAVSARYFRLSSLTSTTGNSLSIWEAKLYNAPGIDTLFTRLATLTPAVAALPYATNPEQLKRVVLELALERAQASLEAGEFTHASSLLDDAENHLAADPATMATPPTGLPYMRVLRPLKQTTTATNPYLKRLSEGATLFLATSDGPFRKNTPTHNVFSDFNYARSTADQMDALFWVFAHPDSPHHHHPELLRRLLRRTYAYLDAINVHGPSLGAGQLASFYDDFAIAPASIVFREFQSLYPGLAPANSTAEWNNAMAVATNNLWSAFANRNASWVNTDVAIAVELFNFGYKAGRQDLLDKAQYFIDSVLTSGRMFEDGAVGYIGTQNEAGGYQGTVASYVNRYYEITGNAQALEILRKMEWYGPINGPMIDWWTSPSWKHAWNFISGSGQTGEATNGKNPYVRATMDASINAAATSSNWLGQQANVAWYEPGTPSLDRPDYTVFDRNIQGPRAWKGLWNYTGTLRAISDSEPGHHTLMGCQIMETSPSFRVNASMMGIFPRIRISSSPSRDTDGGFNEYRHAWLTSKLSGGSTVTPEFSTLAASYKMHVFASSTKGTEHNWTARQVWLNLPDRMIGLLDLSPNANLTAYEVQGAIRLGYGGTSYSTSKAISATGADSWDFGNLSVKLHGHNYAAVTPEVYAFRNVNAPFTEITLRDQADGATNTAARTYTAGDRWKFISEIRPKATTDDVTVTEVAEAGGLTGLEITGPGAEKKYRVIYNPGTAAVAHTPALAWGGPVRIHQSGTRFRPDWVPAPSGALPVNLLATGQAITIEPKAHIVLELLPAPEVSVIITSPAAETTTLATTSQTLHFTASTSQTGAGTPVLAWSKTSGPGTVTFADPASPNPSATFSAPGTYVLRLTATIAPSVAFAERTVIVQPPEDLSLRQGENDYQHTATFIRGDGSNTTWNSGARNQMLVGYNSTGAMRSLLSYDLSAAPATFTIRSAQLDLWTSPDAGSGTVGALSLYRLNATPTEGSGDGSSISNGAGTGATWIRRTDATENLNWTTPGGDFSATALATVPGYAATTTAQNQLAFASSANFLATIEAARLASAPLNLLIASSNTSGAHFTRIHSDDSTDTTRRPLLTLGFSANPLPDISPGTAPEATAGTAADLTGTATNATSIQWQKISGPGTVLFADSSSATTTATFDRTGTYLLRLSASNSNGTSSSDLTVTVSHADAFSAWQESQWGSETDPAIIGPNADPDADGVANLAEFNAATDPNNPSSAVPNLWSATTTGPPLPWSTSAHWTYDAPPVAGTATALEFLTNQTLAAGTITADHDLASPFILNLLTLNGTSTESALFLLTGSTLQFSASGTTTPVLNLNATGTLAYQITNPITLAANTTIQGNGTASFEITGPLGGSGTLTKSGAGKLTLSGDNSFTGAITHNAGKLALTHSNALGTSAKTLSMQGTNRVLELSNNITLPASLTITASSNSTDGGGIHNLSGDNRINGKINFSYGNPGLNIASDSGTLTIANDITLITTSRILYLGGSSTADNAITGAIGQNSPTNVLSLIKQGGGTWILDGTNTHTGTTSVNAGTLVVNGSISNSSALTVSTAATLAGGGGIASPATVHGILSPGHVSSDLLTFTGPLNLTETAAVDWDLASHTSSDQISAATVVISEGALVNLRLNSEGSTVSFTDPFWSAARTWPILTATDLSGSLLLGQVSSDSTGLSPEDGHGRFSLENTSTGTTLHWTPFTDLETWRHQNFGTAENSGNATDSLDFDQDGLSNLLEWALDLDPSKPGPAPITLAMETSSIRYTYTRRKAAANEATFAVEWSDTLTDPWTPVGPGTLHSETANRETLQATIPEGPENRRFIRLRVSAP